MALSVLAAALEFERDLIALEANLDRQIAALERVHRQQRRQPQEKPWSQAEIEFSRRTVYLP